MYESVRKSRINGSSNSDKTNVRENVLPNKVNSRYRFQPIYDNPESFLTKKRIRTDDLDGSRKVNIEDVSWYYGFKPSEELKKTEELKAFEEQLNISTISTEQAVESKVLDTIKKLEEGDNLN